MRADDCLCVRAHACVRMCVCARAHTHTRTHARVRVLRRARALDCRLGVDATQRISLQALEYRELTLAWTPACCRASVQ